MRKPSKSKTCRMQTSMISDCAYGYVYLGMKLHEARRIFEIIETLKDLIGYKVLSRYV